MFARTSPFARQSRSRRNESSQKKKISSFHKSLRENQISSLKSGKGKSQKEYLIDDDSITTLETAESESLGSLCLDENKYGKNKVNRLDYDSGTNFEEEKSILDNVKSLMQKERHLMQIKLLQKEKEIEILKQEARCKDKNSVSSNYTNPRSRPTVSSNSNFRGDDFVEASLALPSQTILDNEQDLEKLCDLNLSDSRLTQQGIHKLETVLPFLPNIKKLDLSCNDLGNSCASSLAKILSWKTCSLESLNLSYNRIGVEAAKTICTALSRNESITDIDISVNPWGKIHDAGQKMGELMAKCRTLRRVKVTVSDPKRERTSGTAKGNSSQFVASLLQSPNIKSLAMVEASLPRPTLCVIAKYGLSLGKLRELDLSMSFIGAQGAGIISRAIIKCSRTIKDTQTKSKLPETFYPLVSLKLKMNGLGPGGATWISKLLDDNKHLTYLDLSSNDLNDESMLVLSKPLRSNTTLRSFVLSRNPIGRGKGVEAFIKALETNTHRISDLGGTDNLWTGVDQKRRLEKALKSKVTTTQEQDNNSNGNKSICLYENSSTQLFPVVKGGLQQTYIQILKMDIPDFIQLEKGKKESKFEIVVKWTAKADWKICCEVPGEGSSVIREGNIHNDEESHEFCVSTQGWNSGESLILSLKPVNVKRNLEVSGIIVSASEYCQGEKEDIRDEYILQERNWDILLQPNKAGAQDYSLVHEVYVHIMKSKSNIKLEWDASLETANEKTLKDHETGVRCAGADWKITKNGSPISLISGSANTNFVWSSDGQRRRYSVDLKQLNICVGDVLALHLRPSKSFLEHCKIRSDSPILIYVRCKLFKTLMCVERTRQQPSNLRCYQLNLAGGSPFVATTETLI